jgi:hypothetical protein
MEVKKDIEIKNLDVFKINMKECDIVYSSDSQYALLYNEGMIAVVDITNNKIISKFTNEKNCRLSKVKFSQNNITYINKKQTHSEIVINNFKFIGQYYEYKIEENVLDYICYDEFLFIVTNSWELYTVNSFENMRRNNIMNDTKLPFNGLNISHMEMVANGVNKNLIMILSNGSILNYRIIGDECFYEDISHVDSFSNNNFNRNDYYKQTGFEFVNMLQSKFTMHYNDYEMKNFGLSKLDINDDQVHTGMFFIVCYCKEENTVEGRLTYNSYISFFEIKTCLIYLNSIKIDNYHLLDSFIYQASISQNTLPDYLILCCRIDESIEIMYSDFFQCFKNKFGDFKKINTKYTIPYFIRKITISTAYLTKKYSVPDEIDDIESENDDKKSEIDDKKSEIDDKKSEIADNNNIEIADNNIEIVDMNEYRDPKYNLSVILRRVEIMDYNLYIRDFEIKQKNTDFPLKVKDKEFLTYDVNKYIDIRNSDQSIGEFKKNAFDYFKKKKFQLKDKDEEKHDLLYLLVLIFNNNLLGLKYLLSLKIKHDQYLIPNDIIFSAANTIYYRRLKEKIYKKLNKNIIDYNFFIDEKLLKNLKTILEIFKISKRRNQTVYHTPFPTENDLIFENSISITKIVEEIEKIILIIKIIRSFTRNIVLKQDKEESLYELLNNLHNNLTNKKRDKILFFELIMLNDYKEIYPFWKILFLNFFLKINADNKLEPDGEINFYFSKLQLFFYYYYVVSDYLNYSNEENFGQDNRQNLREFFNEMNEEFEEYSEICNSLYKLDKYDPDCIGKENIDINILSQLMKYLSGQNFIQNVKINDLIVNNFHITFVSMLKTNGYIKEAIELSKNMNYGESDIHSHLSVLLDLDLYHLAYQFANFTFFNLVSSGELNADSIELISQSKGYSISKKLYYIFFESAIKNNQIEYLLSLPLNFIENSFLKEFLSVNKEYDEILFLYNISIRNLREAENCYKKIPEVESKPVYRNLLIDFKKLYGESIQLDSRYNRFDNNLKIDLNLNKQVARTKIVNDLRNQDSSMLLGIIYIT